MIDKSFLQIFSFSAPDRGFRYVYKVHITFSLKTTSLMLIADHVFTWLVCILRASALKQLTTNVTQWLQTNLYDKVVCAKKCDLRVAFIPLVPGIPGHGQYK